MDERIVDLGENVQWQGLSQFHPHKRTAKYLTQKRILDCGAKIFIGASAQKGIHLHTVAFKDFEYVVSDFFEETGIFIEIISFSRETLRKPLHETVVT